MGKSIFTKLFLFICCIAFVSTNAQTLLVSPGGDDTVDGGLSVTVDPFGAFGSTLDIADDAYFNPPGPLGSSGTTYLSSIFLRTPDVETFLSTDELDNITFTSVSPLESTSQFTIGSLNFNLTQTVRDKFKAGIKVGSVLVQSYLIKNTSENQMNFSLTRYVDGDLDFDGSISDLGGQINLVLFEFDNGADPNNPTTFLGIRNIGEEVKSSFGGFEIDYYSTVRSNIINDIPLDNIVEGDNNNDGITDQAYDIAMALQQNFVLSPNETTEFITITDFGQAADLSDPDPSHVINYEVTLPDCDNPENPSIITEGVITEGENFIFPEYNLPHQSAIFQQYYDALENAVFGIPEGSLIEDITIKINLEGLCDDLLDDPTTQEIIELFFLSVEIIGANSGSHSPLEYYYFENDNEAYLSILKSNLDPLIAFLNFDIDLLTPFFTENGLNPDFDGIRKVVDNTHYTIFARHFSEVRLGVATSLTDVNSNSITPTDYALSQNYPNPFNPSTSISFAIPSNGHVSLSIYDVLGNEVANLENEYKSAGTYSYSFDASNLTSGIYFYTIRSGKFVETKKMLLMK